MKNRPQARTQLLAIPGSERAQPARCLADSNLKRPYGWRSTLEVRQIAKWAAAHPGELGELAPVGGG